MNDDSPHQLPDDLKELERSLEELHPEALDDVSKGKLEAAILHAKPQAELDDNEPPQNDNKRLVIAFVSTLAIAAAFVVTFGLNLGNSANPVGAAASAVAMNDSPEAEAIAPRIPTEGTEISSESTLKKVIDEGIILTEASTRMRQVRTLYTDTVSWVDPQTEARFQLSFDREELFLIPIDAI